MSVPPSKLCPCCQTPAALNTPACVVCGHVYRTKFTAPEPVEAPPTQMYRDPAPQQSPVPLYPAGPPAWQDAPPVPMPPYPAPLPQSYSPGPPVPYAGPLMGHPQNPQSSYAPPVNVFVSTPVTVNNNSGGWWAALLILLFATPVGWVGLFILMALLVLTVKAALIALPLLVALLAAFMFGRSRALEADPGRKAATVVGIILLGLAVNTIYWWAVFQQSPPAAPVDASPATSGEASAYTVPPERPENPRTF